MWPQAGGLPVDQECARLAGCRDFRLIALDALVNFNRSLVNQKQSTPDQNQISPGERLPRDSKQRSGQAHDPGNGRQERQTGAEREDQTEPTRGCLAIGGKAAGEDGQEDKIVDTQDDFHHRQSQQADPSVRIGQKIPHRLSLAPQRQDDMGRVFFSHMDRVACGDRRQTTLREGLAGIGIDVEAGKIAAGDV